MLKRRNRTSFVRAIGLVALTITCLSACTSSVVSVPSPNGDLTVNLSQGEGQLLMSVDNKDERLIAPSPIGLEFEEGSFGTGLKMKGGKQECITDILQNPYETREGRIYEDPDRVVQLRKTVVQGDAIVPYQEEIPYGKGQKGFVAPKEWKITEY
ncbi:MAG: glycoside hydrolase family 97 N-terminal domain-containing protein [Bacteroidaceae bacterium]|nr:glycoside hydrolase family 97 N-terminal domain-containing protein [Bacteroidaceae bacterium]